MKEQFLWQSLYPSIKKSSLSRFFFLFFKPSDFPFENSILEYLQPDSSSSVVARLELIILPFWQRPAEIGEIISISCGEGGSSAPPPPRRSVAASAWRSQQGEVTWVRPEKISSIPSSNELQSLLRPSVHHRSAAAVPPSAAAMPKRSAKIFIFVQ